jgi:dihydroorotase-like cyclic amidohydrolase
VIDMGYHMAVTDLREGGTLEELATLPDQGVTSYKLFMAYKGALMVDDETLFKTMQVAADTGALVMVHAENGDAIDVLVKEALAAGNTEPARARRSGARPGFSFVRGGRISLNRMVELWATNPAKLFGLYPRKGTIAVGSDEDIVVFDRRSAT